jgi:hypothetical protein
VTELVVARFPEGVDPPASLELSGPAPYPHGPVGFAIDWIDANGDVALHLNPRPERGTVALNSSVGGAWQKEVELRGYPFPIEPEVPFHLRFEVLRKRFEVWLDGRRVARFRHRLPPDGIREVRSSTFLWRLDPHARVASSPEVPPHPRSSPPELWARAEENPAAPEPLERLRLFAVLGVWMEEDVIEATVRNAFRQGCERVYLLDDGSPDRTVERALAAGAVLASRYESDRYDEAERMRRLHAVVEEISPGEADDHVWWLYVDGDEFHHGPRGLTLREYLATLDRRFRVVGARLFNHFPDGAPAAVEGRHPLDTQPLCYELPFPRCERCHSNHPLQRWDRGGPPIVPVGGAHTGQCAATLLEPTQGVFFQHFPYREEAVTRRRLERLFGLDGGGSRVTPGMEAHMRIRLSSVDALYRGRLHEVGLFPPCVGGYAPELRPFADWVGAEDAEIARWY